MLSVLCLFLSTMLSVFRSRAALQVEILALRYQIHCAPMLRQETADVDLGAVSSWAWLSGAWADSRSVLVIVKSETVIAWHRKGFRRIREPPTTCSGRPREAGRSGSVTCLPVRPSVANERGMHCFVPLPKRDGLEPPAKAWSVYDAACGD